MAAPFIPLVQVSEAFDVFAGYVRTGISDFEGRVIETDFGDYTHVILNEERIKRVTWIGPTASEPDEVWLWHSKRPKKRQLGIRHTRPCTHGTHLCQMDPLRCGSASRTVCSGH